MLALLLSSVTAGVPATAPSQTSDAAARNQVSHKNISQLFSLFSTKFILFICMSCELQTAFFEAFPSPENKLQGILSFTYKTLAAESL